jgi:hypothetical protein
MVSVLAWSAVDCGFVTRSGKTITKTIILVFVASPPSMQH